MTSVSILCTDPGHPINPHLERWAKSYAGRAKISLLRDFRELQAGDFLFLVSCHQIIKMSVRQLFQYTLVLHASALPQGRGMSPHVWQILNGSNRLMVTLLNAEDLLDSGDIWHQEEIVFDGTELYNEINARLFEAELSLMTWALDHCDSSHPRAQHGEPSFFRRRVPADSRIDPSSSLCESFDLLRIADPERYPAFFEYRQQKYRIRIDKM